MKEMIRIRDDVYVLLGTVSVSSGYTIDELKNMYSLADTVLRKDDLWYITHKTIVAEFEDIIDKKDS
jgi:hypothetical protein|tara:strand:- start:1857 stop:2057 length:201 start_codon:yes stop_codon:yes gene_type:complete